MGIFHFLLPISYCLFWGRIELTMGVVGCMMRGRNIGIYEYKNTGFRQKAGAYFDADLQKGRTTPDQVRGRLRIWIY